MPAGRCGRGISVCSYGAHLQPHAAHAVMRAFYWQVGDGTTTVVILAGELLKECKAFLEEGVHPQVRGAPDPRTCKCVDRRLPEVPCCDSKQSCRGKGRPWHHSCRHWNVQGSMVG